MDLSLHRNRLLEMHRCGFCAELVPASDILHQRNCLHCDQALVWTPQEEGDSLFRRLKSKWSTRRWLIVLFVAIASFFFGQVPMLQSVVLVVALICVHVFLIRKSLNWFPLKRRITAKITIQLIAAFISVLNLVVNALVAVFPVVGGVILSVFSVFNLMVFMHSSLFVIKRRLLWEEQKKPFGFKDWAIPMLFFGMVASIFLFFGLSFYMLVEMLEYLSPSNLFKILNGGS